MDVVEVFVFVPDLFRRSSKSVEIKKFAVAVVCVK